MRILILGGNGMLGHQLFEDFDERHDVRVTLRQPLEAYKDVDLFTAENAYPGVDAGTGDQLREVIRDFRPEAVINCVGIVKQRKEAKEYIPSLEINALLPHRLAILVKDIGARLVHISTDCVFSGRKGNYAEDDASDAEDLYGRSKFLGEVHERHAITLRTSIIGLESDHKRSLIEWFLAQRGKIKGYRRAVYSGLTTEEMARVVERVLVDHPELYGLWHVASAPIRKYELLRTLADKLGRTDLEIEPDDSVVCDRSLNATRFSETTEYTAPSWDAMLNELTQQIRSREGTR